jgi:hypothetical protein
MAAILHNEKKTLAAKTASTSSRPGEEFVQTISMLGRVEMALDGPGVPSPLRKRVRGR